MGKNRKRAIVAVTNDLVTDQRVHKVCLFLVKEGFNVKLVGRKQWKSLPVPRRNYDTFRMRLLFENGPLFYAVYNIRLFLFLLTRKADIIVSNDLDTLPACYLAANIRKTSLVYDTHEYYCGTPELANRPFVRNFWRKIEQRIFPKLNDIITVNDSIAALYKQEYGKTLHVVRNIPPASKSRVTVSRKQLGLPDEKTILILQGAGINVDRGVEELVEAMPYVHEEVMLLIVGSGDVISQLKKRAKALSLGDKIRFIPKVPLEKLQAYTAAANIGLTVDKDTNINYRYSLPNKLFDYIRAGIPIISSRLKEIERIIRRYDIGTFIQNHEPKHMAEVINQAVSDTNQILIWKANLKKANRELTWENEEKTLRKVYEKYK
ncbi:MAG: glycosyltransferase [Bacteroidota bacterium]